MALVTLRIIDGPERGKIYEQLSTPISIGREEGNTVRLNDERVSRFHIKIYENGGVVIAADLDSTNGTSVNGEQVQVWEIKPGDMVSIGRSVILVGSREEIARRINTLRADQHFSTSAVPMGYLQQDVEDEKTLAEIHGSHLEETTGRILEELFSQGLTPADLALLHSIVPPTLPTLLAPHQKAQLLEMLQYFYLRIRYLTASVGNSTSDGQVSLEFEQWQNLLDLYDRLAHYIKKIAEP
ncbi:MAG: FHA domain-containing protein [Planctomycetaceae bacterium]|jgi:pSer/pThr/pTyr-binding forkhead associated (FHA) protein|nr:FHA domain-containing protein [Planctomycetaceae bacterium]